MEIKFVGKMKEYEDGKVINTEILFDDYLKCSDGFSEYLKAVIDPLIESADKTFNDNYTKLVNDISDEFNQAELHGCRIDIDKSIFHDEDTVNHVNTLTAFYNNEINTEIMIKLSIVE